MRRLLTAAIVLLALAANGGGAQPDPESDVGDDDPAVGEDEIMDSPRDTGSFGPMFEDPASVDCQAWPAWCLAPSYLAAINASVA